MYDPFNKSVYSSSHSPDSSEVSARSSSRMGSSILNQDKSAPETLRRSHTMAVTAGEKSAKRAQQILEIERRSGADSGSSVSCSKYSKAADNYHRGRIKQLINNYNTNSSTGAASRAKLQQHQKEVEEEDDEEEQQFEDPLTSLRSRTSTQSRLDT